MGLRSATDEDYEALQGGRPTIVEKDGGGFNIIHDYYPKGDGMIVPTHDPDLGTVIYSINGEPVEFNVAEVKALHGTPCEERSKRYGGDPYRRK